MSRYLIWLVAFLVAAASAASIVNISESDERLIGGTNVTNNAAPFMASMRTPNGFHFCGATIISNFFVVTSAQCTRGRVVANVRIFVGTVSPNTGTQHLASAILQHPSFDPVTLANDISLVNTTIAIVMNAMVQPTRISSHLFGENLPVNVFGWGLVTTDGEDATNLQRIRTNTLNNDLCIQQYNSQSWRVNDNKICTNITPGAGACFGDEGGPILVGDEILGIISWHSNCLSGLPNIFERILPHRLWIRSYIGNV